MAKRNASKQSSKSHKKGKGGAGKQSGGWRIFSAEQRSHRTELNSMTAKEQDKILEAEWQKLSAQQKQAYEAKTPAGKSHGVQKKKSPAHHGQSGAKKTKRGIKQAKKTKKTRRKAAHHAEHGQTQEHETADNSDE